MTIKELLRELKRLKFVSHKDPYEAHQLADKALIKYIDDPEITTAFEEIDKWYE